MTPEMKERKVIFVSGWLTRNKNGVLLLWRAGVSRGALFKTASGNWHHVSRDGFSRVLRTWTSEEYKALYNGIPRKGSVRWVENMAVEVQE